MLECLSALSAQVPQCPLSAWFVLLCDCIIYFRVKNNKCYVRYVFWKVFKNSIKLLTSPFLLTLQNLFTRRALKGHSKGTLRSLQGHTKGNWAINAPEGHLDTWAFKALGHSGSQALKELGLSKDTWTLDTRALKALEQFGTQALGHSGTQRALVQSGSWVLEALEALYIENSKITWGSRPNSQNYSR